MKKYLIDSLEADCLVKLSRDAVRVFDEVANGCNHPRCNETTLRELVDGRMVRLDYVHGIIPRGLWGVLADRLQCNGVPLIVAMADYGVTPKGCK